MGAWLRLRNAESPELCDRQRVRRTANVFYRQVTVIESKECANFKCAASLGDAAVGTNRVFGVIATRRKRSVFVPWKSQGTTY